MIEWIIDKTFFDTHLKMLTVLPINLFGYKIKISVYFQTGDW